MNERMSDLLLIYNQTAGSIGIAGAARPRVSTSKSIQISVSLCLWRVLSLPQGVWLCGCCGRAAERSGDVAPLEWSFRVHRLFLQYPRRNGRRGQFQLRSLLLHEGGTLGRGCLLASPPSGWRKRAAGWWGSGS